MDPDVLHKLMDRGPDSHKYQFGHVLVVGGSPGMVGAPLMTGMAALRTGAGLVTIAAGSRVAGKLERRVKEIMTLELPADRAKAAETLDDFIGERKVSVIVIGPGLEATDMARALLESLLDSADLPVIIDGGALGVLKKRLEKPAGALPGSVILTPHPGEFERLYGKELPAERPALEPIAMRFAERHGVTLVLKGHPTYVAHADGRVYRNATGNPGLATAGTGDVLAGVIAGMIGQGIEPGKAAEAGVYLHGLAGDIAAAAKTQPGMIATDVIEALPAALARAAQTAQQGGEP